MHRRNPADFQSPHAAVLLSDGGLETTLLFRESIELPAFAAFVLLDTDEGRDRLRRYYRSYLEIAATYGIGFVLETPTWRANPNWARSLGYSLSALDNRNYQAVQLMYALRREFAGRVDPIWISGCIGPRGDGYVAGAEMTVSEASDYHRRQIAVLRDSGADVITSFTIPGISEAVGIVRAAEEEDIPVVIGFAVEVDGRLPSGISLQQAIERVDAAAAVQPVCYMVNCAHPDPFLPILESVPPGEAPSRSWTQRIGAVRANASTKSHAELEATDTLDEGNPVLLAAGYRRLQSVLPNLTVVGGCCGTDERHVREIAQVFAGSPCPHRSLDPLWSQVLTSRPALLHTQWGLCSTQSTLLCSPFLMIYVFYVMCS